jgi:hypothetical protein
MRTELCAMVINMDKLLGGVYCPLSLCYLLGSTTAVLAAAQKDHPVGMSWILPVSCLASPVEALLLYGVRR